MAILIGSALLASTTILTAAGRLLVLDSAPWKSADVIVVAIDADGAGALEAADLVHAGVSARVAVFDDPPSEVDREFLRRGLPYQDRAATSIRQLHALGIANVERIPHSTEGSAQEGAILPAWCKSRGYRRVVVVTSRDHSRRLNRILRRAVHERALRIAIQPSPYSEFNPDAWWESRGGVRTEAIEMEKLLVDVVRHPFS